MASESSFVLVDDEKKKSGIYENMSFNRSQVEELQRKQLEKYSKDKPTSTEMASDPSTVQVDDGSEGEGTYLNHASLKGSHVEELKPKGDETDQGKELIKPEELLRSIEKRLNDLEGLGDSQGDEGAPWSLIDRLKSIEKRLNVLETNSAVTRMGQQMNVMGNRVDILMSFKKGLEVQLGQMMNSLADQKKFHEKTFHVFMTPSEPVNTKNFVLVNTCKDVYIASPFFLQDTCTYTVPEDGYYEFYIRWRQTGKGDIRLIIHWNEDSISRLGQTTSENDVNGTCIRRLLKRGYRVWLSAKLESGKANVETVDFSVTFLMRSSADTL